MYLPPCPCTPCPLPACRTCRKILHWKTTLKWPADRIKHLSPECLDFVRCLIQDSDRRLGRNGAEEVMSHPWFRGVDFATLHEQEAPYFTPGLRQISSAMDQLRAAPSGDPNTQPLLKQLTANFDNFDDLPADDPRRAAPGGGAGDGAPLGSGLGLTTRGSRKARSKFVGYTFKRGPDGRTYLPSSGSGSGSGSVQPQLSGSSFGSSGSAGQPAQPPGPGAGGQGTGTTGMGSFQPL